MYQYKVRHQTGMKRHEHYPTLEYGEKSKAKTTVQVHPLHDTLQWTTVQQV